MPRRPSRVPGTLLVLLALLGMAGCTGSSGGSDSARAGDGAGHEIVVFAAASLTGAFTEIGRRFEAEHPGTKVTLNFAGSSSLLAQLAEGAPADVFAAADEATMARLNAAGGVAGSPTVFATNELAIIVAPGNPEAVRSLADLARPGLLVVLAAIQVPAGAYAQQALDRARVALTPVSRENDVKAVAAKVVSGEVDAGIVYRTDVEAAGGRAVGVAIPADLNVTARYPIAVTADATHPTTAASFVTLVTGPLGQDILARAGFGPP